ncbi:MAG TPA: hypothetical protein VIH05_03460 [Tepidiformaceae bacterium]
MLRITLLIGLTLLAMVPFAALAQGVDDDDDFTLQVNRDYTLPAGESVGGLVVVNGDALIEGTVRDFLVVVEGTADISGSVKGLTVVNGDAILRDGATVTNDVLLVRSTLDQQPGSTVGGEIEERSRFLFRGAWLVFGLIFWLGATLALIVGGLLFAAIGGRQLRASTANLSEQPGPSILAAVIVLFAVPLLAVLAMVTIVGIPLGIGILLFLLPALALLGYLVAADWLGGLVLSGFKRDAARTKRYLPVVIGVLMLQAVSLIPAFGWAVWALAALYGLGGLTYLAWRTARGYRSPPPGVEAAPA